MRFKKIKVQRQMVRLLLKKNVLYLCRKYGLPKTPICNAGKASILATLHPARTDKTPICNAGKASILATLHPARTDYLYFVAKKDLSGHIFAKDFQEHFRNKSTTKN